MKCIFCSLDEKRIVLESSVAIAILDKYPVSKGHVLVIPKKHIDSYFKLGISIQQELWRLVNEVRLYLLKEYNPEGFNIGINDGITAGQTISHCHIHVIPRYQGDHKNPQGGVRGVIPSKMKYNDS